VTLLSLSSSYFGKEITPSDSIFQIGDKLINRNILFGYNDSCFLPESYSSLDSILVFLEKNKNLCIEVGVHTDSRFSGVYSTCLSCIRSRVINSYLVSKGINANRITSKGYNDDQLIISDAEIKKLKTDAEKEEAHRLNRRLEFKITCVDFEVADVRSLDKIIGQYLEKNKDRFTSMGGYPVSYMKDRTIREARDFTRVNIGRNTDSRFVTEQVIFIDSLTQEIYEFDASKDSLILWQKFSNHSTPSNDIPPNGKYRFDMAFAEWQGQSMGEKVTVIINDENIKVIYEGDGQLTQSKISDVFEEGIIMKHKSGVWIIGKQPSDAQLDEIGGCTGGPTIIDFENKKYWTC
jgi:hypothetical protein